MSKQLYIADWHYNHKSILAYDNRPFKSLEEMNEALVQRWNEKASDRDKVYVLGDMFWCKSSEAVPILKSLNGEKILIKGNHDRSHDGKFRSQFEKIVDYLEIVDGDRHVVLCHYPMPCFKNHYHGWYHLYAHVHNSFEFNMMEHDKFLMRSLYGVPCNMYNVGAMMPWMNYAPQTLDDIIAGASGDTAIDEEPTE